MKSTNELEKNEVKGSRWQGFQMGAEIASAKGFTIKQQTRIKKPTIYKSFYATLKATHNNFR